MGRRFVDQIWIKQRMDRKDARLQREARARAVTVVCDGWAEPRHPRIILTPGDPSRISHGMCPACATHMETQ